MQSENGRNINRQGRVRTDLRRRRALVEAYERSGLSQAEFCRRRDLNPKTFSVWRRASSSATLAFAEVQLPTPEPAGDLVVEILLREDVRIRVPFAGNVGGTGALIREIVRC